METKGKKEKKRYYGLEEILNERPRGAYKRLLEDLSALLDINQETFMTYVRRSRDSRGPALRYHQIVLVARYLGVHPDFLLPTEERKELYARVDALKGAGSSNEAVNVNSSANNTTS